MESTTARQPARTDVGEHPGDPLREEEELVERLAAQGFTGPETKALVKRLSVGATGALEAWFVSGDISKRVRIISRHDFEMSDAELAHLRRNREELAALIDRIIRKAATLFTLRALRAREWDPAQNASLQTWFNGGALLKAKDEVRQWRKRRRQWSEVEQRLAHGSQETLPDHADLVAAAVDLDSVFTALELNEVERRIAGLYSEGHSYRAIADLFGLSSPHAVRRLVNRLRKHYTDKSTEGGSHV
jgi:DNA-directed RNA polymerase specialized sigma24 family protein